MKRANGQHHAVGMAIAMKSVFSFFKMVRLVAASAVFGAFSLVAILFFFVVDSSAFVSEKDAEALEVSSQRRLRDSLNKRLRC